MIATGIHRFCLNHPALVLSQSTSVFPKTEPYWVPMHTARLSSGPHAYPILMVTSMRLKLYYLYVLSQPATVRILANDVQVVTAPPYKESLGRQGHPKNIMMRIDLEYGKRW